MNVGRRMAFGFDKAGWKSFGVWIVGQTVWIDCLGFYLNLYLGRKDG